MPSDDIVALLRECTCVPHGEICREAADEIERLRAERDEARREICGINESGLRMNDSDKHREAKRRGWILFKEES